MALSMGSSCSRSPQPAAEKLADLRTRAENGGAPAQFNLAMMYADGDGVPRGAGEAVKWFRRAAEQGDASAQLNLGLTCSGRSSKSLM